jgi:hypothetical protein
VDEDPLARWKTYGSIQNPYIKVSCPTLSVAGQGCADASAAKDYEGNPARCPRHLEASRQTRGEARRQVRSWNPGQGKGHARPGPQRKFFGRNRVGSLHASVISSCRHPKKVRLKVWRQEEPDSRPSLQVVCKGEAKGGSGWELTGTNTCAYQRWWVHKAYVGPSR